jgi:DNA-binding PadR family transcriptional regulator
MRRPVRETTLGEFELVVLLAVLRLEESAYGVTILREIHKRAGRPVARGAVYITLDRLESKGYLRSSLADPTPQRGGKAKRLFHVSAQGISAVREYRRVLVNMWQDLEPLLGKL